MTISKPWPIVLALGVIFAVSAAFWIGALFGVIVPQAIYSTSREGMIAVCARDEIRRSGGRLTLEKARMLCACEQDTMTARTGFDRPRYFGITEWVTWVWEMDETVDDLRRIEQACREELG